MKIKILGLLLITYILTSCNNDTKNIVWVSSDTNIQWQTQNLKSLEDSEQQQDEAIIIYPNKTQQVIDGFGGCFNELGWEALSVLQEDQKNKVITSLFDTTDGCKFNICRMPIGASDFGVDWYSHNEYPDDFMMEHFSIDRDKKRLIPYINMAKSFNQDLKIWASPWCPPSWMKTNKHYACNPSPANDLSADQKGNASITQFILEPQYLNAYALYFTKFLDAYKDEGIDIYAIHVQNEPYACQDFPSCIWKPFDLVNFIGDYLGPKFEKDNRKTEIWLGTINNDVPANMDTMLEYEPAQKYIEGIGFQWSGKGVIPYVNSNYPDYKLMQTESECGDGSNDWKAAEYTYSLMKHYLNNGANSYMYWNMILNETANSQWGWKQNSMITIDSKKKEVTYNPEFYLMKHFSHFIEEGAIKVESSQENCLAFKKDDKLTIIYYNSGDSQNKQFLIENMKFDVSLSERSFNTFIVEL